MTTNTVFEDSFSEEIWNSTYRYYKDNTVDDTFRRVAKAVSSVEKTNELKQEWEEKFYDMLSDFKITAGGRIYANAGTDYNGTSLINCFVGKRESKNVDSVPGIVSHLLNQMLTLKSEGGWGENFSYIRPRGSFIKSIGVESPGAVKYMELFDKSSDIITAGSGLKSTNTRAKKKIRKGAMMGVINDWHPDIIEFITAKQQPGRLQKFNVSVNISNKFMEKLDKIFILKNSGAAVEEISKENSWELKFPDTEFEKYDTEWDGNLNLWESKGYPVKIHNTTTVEWLWNLITQSTYNRAEPGIIFGDIANENSPFNYGEYVSTTNPCLRGDVLISTKNGEISISDLVKQYENGQEIEIKTYNIESNQIEFENIENAFLSGKDKELLELVFDDGNKLFVTPDHKIFTKNRGYIEAKDLTEEDDFVYE